MMERAVMSPSVGNISRIRKLIMLNTDFAFFSKLDS